MKRRIFVPAVLALSLLMPCTSFAASEWYINKFVTVLEDTEFTMENAPTLTVSADSMFKDDFSFELDLTNAEWLYGDKGTLADGLDYIKLGDNELFFKVDFDKFRPDENNIEVPLYCKVIKGVAEVNLICDDYIIRGSDKSDFGKTPDESKTTAYYGSASGDLSGDNDELNVIGIKEYDLDEVKKGDKYTLTLNNGFVFTGDGKVTGADSFVSSDLDIAFDKDKPDTCVITVKNDIKNVTGSILVTGLKIKSTSSSLFKGTDITVTKSADKKFSAVLNVGKLIQTVPSDAPLKVAVVTMDRNSIKARGTGAPGKKIRIVIGGEVATEIRVDSKGVWRANVEFNAEMEAGLYHVEIGYYSASTDKFTFVSTADFNITAPVITTTAFKLGEKSVTVNGVKTDIDGQLFIDENNRMMAPVRAFANAFGIKDSYISWNDANKTVTIVHEGKIIILTIGSDVILINGEKKDAAAKAVIKDGRAYLPLRDVADAFGTGKVEWNDTLKTAYIIVKK